MIKPLVDIKRVLGLSIVHLYIILAALLLVGLIAFNNQSMLQFEIIILAAITYVTLALAHHHFDKSLTLETFIEYILIALFIVIIVQGQLI